ncbi:MAG: agglutinin biogenesis protein MshI [Leptothrix sp. (in: b-proteobacteria)]
MHPGWVAVAPQGADAWVVHLVHEPGNRPQLRWACRIDWRQPAQALRQLRRERQLARHQSVVLLQRHQYQLLALEAPDVPREHWRDALRWQLKDMVDFPVESAAIDLLEIAAETSGRGRISLLAAAAPHTELAPLAHAGEDAATPWHAIDLPDTALRNLAALAQEPGRAQALLQLGDSHSQLVITAEGELLQSRSIDVTLTQLSESDATLRQQAWDRAGLELQRTLDSFERLFSRVNLARLLIAPGSASTFSDAFIDYLRELVYVPVQPLPLAELVDFSRVPELAEPHAQGPYLYAIGAALRGA